MWTAECLTTKATWDQHATPDESGSTCSMQACTTALIQALPTPEGNS